MGEEERDEVGWKNHVIVETLDNGDTIRISGVDEERLVLLGTAIYVACDGTDNTPEQCRELLLRGELLRPKSMGIQLRNGVLTVDTWNFRGDPERRHTIETAVTTALQSVESSPTD